MRIAVIGNTSVNGGVAVAADTALCGHDVSLTPWPGEDAAFEGLAGSGIQLAGRVEQAHAGRGGPSPVRLISDLAVAVSASDLVILDVAPPDFSRRFAQLLPHLPVGQLVHVNMHGYWPALTLSALLRAAGREDVTLSESMAPSHAAEFAGGVVKLQCVRGKVQVAVFPAERTGAAIAVLQTALPNIVAAKNILETGFAGLNMMIHFPLVLTNVGWCDRLEAAGMPVPLYTEGMTAHTSRLVAALDRERQDLCAAYGVPFKSLPQHLAHLYGAHGDTAAEAVASAQYYRDLSPYGAAAWRRWMSWDMPHAYAPFVAFARLAGVATPLHHAALHLMHAMIGMPQQAPVDPLDHFELADCTIVEVLEFVQTGIRP